MKKASERDFEVGQYIYVVDYWGTSNGTQAFGAGAKILEVDKKKRTFLALLYGETCQTYSFKEYGRLIFDTSNEAAVAADKLPKPQTTVYQVIGKRVYKKLVIGIGGQHTEGIYDLVVCLNKGKDVSTKEIGYSLFLRESDARENKK